MINNKMKLYPLRNNKTVLSQYVSISGFTLIELIVSMVIGLLVVAAAISVLVTSSQTKSIQEASSSIQDSVVFPINTLKHHLRRANYGAQYSDKSGYFLTHDTPQGGVVMTAPDVIEMPVDDTVVIDASSLSDLKFKGAVIPTSLLTGLSALDSNVSIGTDALKNDQLTIQYQMPVAGQLDCMGRGIPKDYHVIERYFVKNSALSCAATNYKLREINSTDRSYIEIQEYTKTAGGTEDAGFDGDGTVLIQGVDYFRVLFGVTDKKTFATSPTKLRMINVPASATPATDFNNLRIANIQVGLILRSSNPTGSAIKNADQTFSVLDKSGLKLNATAADRHMRDVYESSILLRNARGRD